MFGFARRFGLFMGLLAVLAFPGVASANHSWGGYHWARQSNPFTLKLGNNLSGTWTGYLSTTSGDWTQSTVLNTTVVAGQAKGRCRGTTGWVEVCNAAYGNNGWLGVASISITGGTHITQGTVKVNDTYFDTAQYNSAPWRNLVMCQEVGHTLGLDHQDTNFTNANLGTCMDYTNSPTGGGTNGTKDNEHPNTHDYDELATIYSHTDSSTTVGQPAPATAAGESRAEWGREVARSSDGHTSVFVRDLGAGQRILTFVIWA